MYRRLIPQVIRQLREISTEEAAAITEIRIRLGRPMEFVFEKRRMETAYKPNEKEMEDLLAALCGYTRYAYESQIAAGFIPLPDGHRVGVCGRVQMENSGRNRMSDVTSVCIRIARSVPGASEQVRAYLQNTDRTPARVLFIGPPGCGKTTLLRDAALYLSDTCGFHVGVADEREELFPLRTLGQRLDVLPGVRKSTAIPMLIRSMAPDVIVTDEIGDRDDASAILDAARCGVGLLCSAHGNGIKSLMGRPAIRTMIESGAFDRYIELGTLGMCRHVWEYAEGRLLAASGLNSSGELGYCGHDDDIHMADGLSAGAGGTGARAIYPGYAKVSGKDGGSDPL